MWSINFGGWKDLFNINVIDVLVEKVCDKVERFYQCFLAMGLLSIVGYFKGGFIVSFGFLGKFKFKNLFPVVKWRTIGSVIVTGDPWVGKKLGDGILSVVLTD